MRLAILELPARSGESAHALAEVEHLLGEAPCDLALLGECALTGYVDERGDFDRARFAEPLFGPTLERLSTLARIYDCFLAAPLVESAGGSVFNSFLVLDRLGNMVAHYRKRHPWFPERWATPGQSPYPVLAIEDVRMALAVCFDVHFLDREIPEVLSDVDLLLFPSAWCDEGTIDLRTGIFERLVRDFGVEIANANWGVGVPWVLGQGRSRFVPREGAPLLLLGRPGEARRMDVEVTPRAGSPRPPGVDD